MASGQTLAVGERGAGSPERGEVSATSGELRGVSQGAGGSESTDSGVSAGGVQASRLDPAEIGTFDIIYADPPWFYDNHQFMGDRITSSASRHYATMTSAELRNLPVESIAADDCLMFIWSTPPTMDVALDVIKAWGFRYVTIAFVWDKQRVNPGYYTMSQCEIVIVAKRGRIPRPRGARNIRQLVSEKATKHSRKPEEVRRRIEAMFPEQRKIELFARGVPAPGWTAWGEEVGE